MWAGLLKPKCCKSDVIIISPATHDVGLTINNPTPSAQIRSLGVILGSNLTSELYVNHVNRIPFSHI